VPFPCPGCGAAVPSSPARWALRCPSCHRVLRARVVEAEGPEAQYDVEVAGEPATRQRVSVAWNEGESRRLRRWLAWSTGLTLALVFVLYALARWAT
jgi:hypothetical protein